MTIWDVAKMFLKGGITFLIIFDNVGHHGLPTKERLKLSSLALFQGFHLLKVAYFKTLFSSS